MKSRNIVTAILLSIVTCGIYGIYWLYCVCKDVCELKGEKLDIVTFVLLLFLPFIGFFLLEKKFVEVCAAKGVAHEDRSILYLIVGIIGFAIVDLILVQNDLNSIIGNAQ